MRKKKNYSQENDTQENSNSSDKYAVTGESEYTREQTIPVDEDEVLSERHYTFDAIDQLGKRHLRAREPRSGPVSGDPEERSQRSDQMIETDVRAALYRSTVVDARDIDVVVKEGEVTLRGAVNSPQEIKLAQEVIERVPGVRSISNEIQVRVSRKSTPNPKGLIDNITGLN